LSGGCRKESTGMEKDQQELLASVSQEALSEKQIFQLQADLIGLAHDAIIVRDPANRITAWNRSAQALYGWRAEEAFGRSTHTLLQTCFPESLAVVELALAQHGYWEGQLTHFNQDGTPRIVDSRQFTMRDERNQVTAILEVNRDMTSQVQLQQERAQAQATEMALRETAQQMDTFLSIVSHELKTPLTAAKGNVQLAQRQLIRLLRSGIEWPDTEAEVLSAMQKFLERAERQINTQNRMVNDLVDVSRIQSGQLNLQLALCDLSAIVQQTIEEWRVLVPNRPIQWDDTAASSSEVLIDADRIAQVVNNYLSNALKYSEANTPVVVWLDQEESHMRLSVRDKGPGLSPEQQEHIWERFFHLEEIEVKSGSGIGLGLGLYICRNLIEQQGGQVGIQSGPDAGSTFWFTLPLIGLDGKPD
jgi:PAS domain S-box-containing protein